MSKRSSDSFLRKMLSFVASLAVLIVFVIPRSSPANACPEFAPPDSPEQRGCCSHHQGVCGCSGGRTQCCDGTASPSCTC
jgi:hypothetical protein